jgi:hypothetical protein
MAIQSVKLAQGSPIIAMTAHAMKSHRRVAFLSCFLAATLALIELVEAVLAFSNRQLL